MEEINVLCCLDEKFILPCGVMLDSLFDHHPKVRCRIYVIHSFPNLSQEIEKLLSFILKKGNTYTLLYLSADQMEGFPVSRHASLANYYRLFCADLISPKVQKVLYLDCDILVLSSLQPLWNVEMGDNCLAAVEQEGHEFAYLGLKQGSAYFNSGVMLINLDKWREGNVRTFALDLLRRERQKIDYWDQDILNILFDRRWLQLPRSWNYMQNKRTVENVTILHFAGQHKPWEKNCEHAYRIDYLKRVRKYLGNIRYLRFLYQTFGWKGLFTRRS